MSDSCAVVMYHYVRDAERTEFSEIKALPVEDFRQQVEWLKERYQLLDYPTFERYVLSGEGLGTPTALLTFDDGFSDHYETVFPILKEHGVSGVFFASDSVFTHQPMLLNVHRTHLLLSKLGLGQFEKELAGALEEHAGELKLDQRERSDLYRLDSQDTVKLKRLLNYELPYDVLDVILSELFQKHIGDEADFAKKFYMTTGQIREMSESGMTFGAHTRDHRVPSRLNEQEQREQLQNGVQLVRDATGQKSVPFCYPYGLDHTYNEHTLALLRELGYSLGFTVGRALVRFGEHNRLELPRFDTNEFPPRSKSAPEA